MESQEFIQVRHNLVRTQNQIAGLLNISLKSVQSYEQGWRKIPASVEKQLMFLLFLKGDYNPGAKLCWEIKSCPFEWRRKCLAWELRAGHFCWFINGTFCHGHFEATWKNKIEICCQCEVFQQYPYLAMFRSHLL